MFNKLKSAIYALLCVSIGSVAYGSSHSEAPLISGDPQADWTDVYAFSANGKVVIVGNVYPLMAPDAGPNWYRLDPLVQYQFIIERPDATVTYRFTVSDQRPFVNPLNPIAFFPGIGFNSALGRYQNYDLAQVYNVDRIVRTRGGGTTVTSVLTDKPIAPQRIGAATTDHGVLNANGPGTVTTALQFNSLVQRNAEQADINYDALANQAISSATNGDRFFVGPRNDPFYVDLGGIFSGLIRPGNRSFGQAIDSLQGKNVFSFVLELNQASVFSPAQITANDKTFGLWTNSLRRNARLGAFQQVSRLGNPLFNETIVRLANKDRYNATAPINDVALYGDDALTPPIAGVLNALYASTATGAPANGLVAPVLSFIKPDARIQIGSTVITDPKRADLLAIFLQGVPNVNQFKDLSNNLITGDFLRCNLNNPVGWPNCRGLKEDVVKTALVALSQCKISIKDFSNNPLITVGQYTPTVDSNGLIQPLNCDLDDGITEDDRTIGGSGIDQLAGTPRTPVMPYVGIPHSGFGIRGPLF